MAAMRFLSRKRQTRLDLVQVLEYFITLVLPCERTQYSIMGTIRALQLRIVLVA